MNQSIHHVPGRLRIRSTSFRRRSISALSIQDRLLALDGVTHVRLNPDASSITIHYDTARLSRAQLLAVLEHAGCLGAQTRSDDFTAKTGQLLGKALMGAIVKKVAERSALKLVSVLL